MTIDEADVKIVHHFGGGVYCKETHIPAGLALKQHVHDYDHLSVLASGLVWVISGDLMTKYHAPAFITIKAGVSHEVHAVEDSVWGCIHATDCNDPDRVDEVLKGESHAVD